jgi:small subunit ribosomal protein S20
LIHKAPAASRGCEAIGALSISFEEWKMPHTPSAKKRMRQYEKNRRYNRAYKKAIKEQVRKFLEIVKTGSPDQVQAEYSASAKKLDKAAARRVIHPNKAARKKSQLASMLAAKKAPAPK